MDKTIISNDAARRVPYDTGKVKIGMFYEPPKKSMEDHELILQNALLGLDEPKEPIVHRILASLPAATMFLLGFALYLIVLFRS